MADVEKLDIPEAKPRWRMVGALAANAIPVIGVVFWGWNAGVLLLLYWFENVAIGVFNAVRMIAAGLASGPMGAGVLLFLIPFYTFHYGLFCLVHGVFVWVMFGQGLENLAALNDLDDPLDLPRLFATIVGIEPGMKAGVASVLIWQGVLLAIYFIRREWRGTDPMSQMMAPYGRIIILHFTIIGGGFIVMLLGQPWIGVVILALIKTAFDVLGDPTQKNMGKNKEAWDQARAQIGTALKNRKATLRRPR